MGEEMNLEKKECRQLTVDEEFKSLIPTLTDQEYDALSESLDKNGCLDPITVWNDTIVDGHNRYQLCRLRKTPFWINRLEFENRDEVKVWILNHQLSRRNLTNFQKCELALKLKEMISQKAKENQRSRGVVSQKSANPIDTRETLANIAGVSHDTLSKVEKIIENAPEKEIQRLRNGEAKINTVYSRLKSSEKNQDPKEEDHDEKRFGLLLKEIDIRIDKLLKMKVELPDSCRKQLSELITKLEEMSENTNAMAAA